VSPQCPWERDRHTCAAGPRGLTDVLFDAGGDGADVGEGDADLVAGGDEEGLAGSARHDEVAGLEGFAGFGELVR
jgi:hypothetical protein